MNETETRAEHITPALSAAGWGTEVASGKFSRIRHEYVITAGRIEGGGRRARGLIADYVLVYQNTPLAVVEAKAWDKPLTEGVAQAKLYAQKLSIRFAYATNGQGVYEIDMATGAEGEVAAVPSPQALWARTFAVANAWRERLAQVPFEDKSGTYQARYYQDSAVAAVLEALCEGKNRMLLTLATGTGKTNIAFQLAWKLFHARWNVRDWPLNAPALAASTPRRPRILMLADRVILADQAFSAFSAFPEDALVRISPDEIRKKGRVPTNGSVFFTIFQTFMSGGGVAELEGDEMPSVEPGANFGTNFGANFGEYPPDFFDFIIVDECHRGGANDEGSWRAILEYFSPAVQLGLTATPKREANADTYRYFGEPVYTYSLKDGINDGFLTPFRVKQIATTLDDYQYTADDTVVKGEIDASKRYEEGAFNREIIIPEREKRRVEIFMRDINQAEKTLVFCATQEHALMVRDFINQVKRNPNPDYCHRVAADDGKVGDQHLSTFQDNEKTIPTILTTSRKLSTGVDARNVRNIVLMRPVGSMIEFKQIIGRGTRLYEGKDYFTIYDFVQAYKRFSDAAWDGDAVAVADLTETTQITDMQEKPEPVPMPEVGGGEREPRGEKVTIRLADGKARRIAHMMSTSFWHPDGKPMSAAQFVESLFGELPQFFSDEDELRSIWSDPDTRRKLLDGLAEKGFDADKMAAMQALIDAPNSDLFDVLAHVAFAAQPHTRSERASGAKGYIANEFNLRQQAFLDFVLRQYVDVGVSELAVEKLVPLLKLKYNDSLPDALADLGDEGVIRQAFVGFQRHLYQSNFVRT